MKRLSLIIYLFFIGLIVNAQNLTVRDLEEILDSPERNTILICKGWELHEVRSETEIIYSYGRTSEVWAKAFIYINLHKNYFAYPDEEKYFGSLVKYAFSQSDLYKNLLASLARYGYKTVDTKYEYNEDFHYSTIKTTYKNDVYELFVMVETGNSTSYTILINRKERKKTAWEIEVEKILENDRKNNN